MAAKKFREIFWAEDQAIRLRRSQATVDQTPLPSPGGPSGENGQSVSEESDGFPRTGIALSGGGIRSASFGLGFLQAMYRHGVLRQVDYLSTVSGGSYVGCYLSSLVADRDENSITLDPSATTNDSKAESTSQPHHPAQPDENGQGSDASTQNADAPLPDSNPRNKFQSNLPLLPRKSGSYTDDLKRLSQAGKALNRPLAFFNRLFQGMLLINLTALSGTLCLAALFAVAYRSLYNVESQYVLEELGFVGDLLQPWFPSAVLFPIWLATCWKSRERTVRDLRAEGRWQQINNAMFLLLVASMFMAMASLLTVADPSSIASLTPDKSKADASARTSSWMSWISHIAVGAICAALIPYLRPKELIRSGTDPQSPTKNKWVFNIASRALLFGIPLVIFGLICQENISGYHDNRENRYSMIPMSVGKWHSFWRRVYREAAEDRNAVRNGSESSTSLFPPGLPDSFKRFLGIKVEPPVPEGISLYLWNNVAESDPSDLPGSGTMWDSILLSEKLDSRSREYVLWHLWNPRILSEMWNPWTLKTRIEERRRFDRWRVGYINQLNERCLSDPSLFRHFRPETAVAANAGQQNFDGQIEHAEDLESAVIHYLKGGRPKAETLGAKLNGEIDRLRTEAEDLDPGNKNRRAAAEQGLNQLIPLQAEIRKTNWDLLRSHYGDDLRTYDTIFSYVVLEADQTFRFMIAWGFGFLFLLLGFLVSLNSVSIHSYYRQQLASVWIHPVGKLGREVRLEDVDTVSRGFPYHLINATLHQFGRKRDAELFIFTPKCFGSHQTLYAETEKAVGGMRLADAMANSGAAVSPITTRNPLVRVLLLLANFRLGQWLPNPAKDSPSRFPQAPLPMLRDMLRGPNLQNYCFVTDGGIADNTGIASLLHRRCRVILAVDASQDEQCHFRDLLKLLENQRTEFGRSFSAVPFQPSCGTATNLSEPLSRDHIPLEMVQSNKRGKARSHYVVMEILYPKDRYTVDAGLSESRKGYLIYVKPSFDGDEPSEVEQYRLENPTFPHDPTYDQFFDSHKFESYRGLGEHIGLEVWKHLFEKAKEDAEKHPVNAQGRIFPWLSHWRPFARDEKGHRTPDSNGSRTRPATPDSEEETRFDLEDLRELVFRPVPFVEKQQAFQHALDDPDPDYRLRVCVLIGDYLESLRKDSHEGQLSTKERRQLCLLIMAQFDKEEGHEDIRQTICLVLRKYGGRLREVKLFFERRDVKEFSPP